MTLSIVESGDATLDPQMGALEHQARLIADMTAGFASALDIAATLDNAIGRFMTYLDAEAASIFLLESDGRELVCRECAGTVDLRGLRLDVNQGIVGKAVRERAGQMVHDARADPDFAAWVDAGTGFVTRSILCAPLIVQGKVIGVLELINKRSGDGLFSARDQHLLTAIASSAALAIHNARMAAALVEQERIQKELELARQIQLGLLPGPPVPDFPAIGLNLPARAVSGDFYDFLRLDDGRIYFSLGDVSGKGINAALLMARTSSLLRVLAKRATDPGRLLAAVNDELCETASNGMFVTLVAGFMLPGSGTAWFANGGHPPALHYEPEGSFREYGAEAPPLGVVRGIEFPSQRAELAGGALYLYTDGVTESYVNAGGRLDLPGLKQIIRSCAAHPRTTRLNQIVDQIRHMGREQGDDITLMLIEDRRP
jgi:sigma-B regulation protein RsbU (phosphoserine phosphatase)